jgi:hypothetical protein
MSLAGSRCKEASIYSVPSWSLKRGCRHRWWPNLALQITAMSELVARMALAGCQPQEGPRRGGDIQQEFHPDLMP